MVCLDVGSRRLVTGFEEGGLMKTPRLGGAVPSIGPAIIMMVVFGGLLLQSLNAAAGKRKKGVIRGVIDQDPIAIHGHAQEEDTREAEQERKTRERRVSVDCDEHRQRGEATKGEDSSEFHSIHLYPILRKGTSFSVSRSLLPYGTKLFQ